MKTIPWMIAISSLLLSSLSPAQAATTAQLGVFRPQTGQWFVDYSGNHAWDRCGPDGCLGQFGAPIDLPVTGDWSGNGVPNIGVFRPADGRWYLDLNGNSFWDGCGTDGCFGPFGAPVDRPVIGDWDGTGTLRFGVFRPTTGQWYFDLNGNGTWDGCGKDRCQGTFGAPEDWPVAGDMDGDNITEFGVYRPSTGMWYFDFDHNGSWSGCGADGCMGPFGAPEDRPVMTDIDGNGQLEFGVFRPSTSQWYFDLDHNGTWSGCGADGCFGGFGGPGDLPVVGAWDRYAGPGDPLNYFPLTQGSTWTYQGSYSDSDGFFFTYQNTATVSGTRIIDGVTSSVVSISNPGGEGPFEEYLLKDGRGITNWGNNDPADTITPLVAAYQEIIFPLWTGASFKQFELAGVDLGDDLDGDGINERVNMSSQVTVAGFESVVVTAGSFSSGAKVVNTISISGSVSSLPSLTFTGTTTATTWYAPGTGPVKIEISMLVTASNGGSFSSFNSESLASYLIAPPSVAFLTSGSFPIATSPTDIATGDFSSDGKTDLAITNWETNAISVLPGDDLGAFGLGTSFAVGEGPRAVTSADFNKDGKLDLAVANETFRFPLPPGTVSVLNSNNLASFDPAVGINVGNRPMDIVNADLNHDGYLDLVTANQFSYDISVMLGLAGGGFSAESRYPATGEPVSLKAADFNNDGHIDLAIAGISAVSVLLGAGDGTFSPPTAYPAYNAMAVATGDLNGDGTLDMVTADDGTNQVTIRLGDGTGAFGPGTALTVAQFPRNVMVTDLNGDGLSDLVVATEFNGGIGSNSVYVLLGYGRGVFGPAIQVYNAGGFAILLPMVAVADFNADGKKDLAVTDSQLQRVAILLNSTP